MLTSTAPLDVKITDPFNCSIRHVEFLSFTSKLAASATGRENNVNKRKCKVIYGTDSVKIIT